MTEVKEPVQGDYLNLGGEHHTIIDRVHRTVAAGCYLIEDERGEDFVVCRYPEADNPLRRAWRLSHPQAISK